MFNELIVGTVVPFSGSQSTDKNGESPVMIQCIAGRMPLLNVLTGTVAKNMGIETGKSYLFRVMEEGTHVQFGFRVNFLKLKELITGTDIIESCKDLGPAEVFKVDKPAGYDYQRKSVVVEGQKTKDIKAGLFKPAIVGSSTDHSNAKTIVDGTSTEQNNDFTTEEENSQKQGNRKAA